MCKITLEDLKQLVLEKRIINTTENKNDESFTVEFDNGSVLYLNDTEHYPYFRLYRSKIECTSEENLE